MPSKQKYMVCVCGIMCGGSDDGNDDRNQLHQEQHERHIAAKYPINAADLIQ